MTLTVAQIFQAYQTSCTQLALELEKWTLIHIKDSLQKHKRAFKTSVLSGTLLAQCRGVVEIQPSVQRALRPFFTQKKRKKKRSNK